MLADIYIRICDVPEVLQFAKDRGIALWRMNVAACAAYRVDTPRQNMYQMCNSIGIPMLVGKPESCFMDLASFNNQGYLYHEPLDFSINNSSEYKALRLAELDTEELKNNIAKFKLLKLLGVTNG